MSLSVLNNLSAIYAENNLNKTSNSLSKVLNELSSGSRINSGADDAAGLSLVDGLAANQAALTQSATNASEGVGLLTVADGALSQVTSLLNRAVTLATEAANGTLNTTQDVAANQEYQSILSEISNIGSTTTYNQEQVFGTTSNIYTGDSTSTGASIDTLNIRSLSSSNVGDSSGSMSYSSGADNVFVDLSNTGKNASQSDSLSGTTNSMTVSYLTKGSNNSVVQATATITVGSGTNYANTVDGLISAINNSGLGISASFGTATSAGTGAVAAATDAADETSTVLSSGSDTGIIISGSGIGVNSTGYDGVGVIGKLTVADTTTAADAASATLSGTLSITGSDGTAHSVTLGTANSTDTLTNLANYVNQQSWGVTATYDSTNYVDTFTSGSSKASVTATTTPSASYSTDTVTATLSAQPETAGTATSTELDTLAGTAAGGNLVIGSHTVTITAAEAMSSVASAINKASYGVTAAVNSSGALVISSANSVNPTITTTDTGLTVTAVAKSSSPYYSVGISGSITDSSTTGGTGVIGMSNDTNGSNGIATISYSDSAGQSLTSTDLLSQSDAQSTLTSLNSAIAAVASQDGYIGAQINLLNSVSSVLSTQSENVTSAQNAVQATDYAATTSEMSKYQILSQTGIAALAQANSMQQEVVKLLQ